MIAYDIEGCWVEVMEHDDKGFLIHRDGEWATRRIYGQVTVHLLSEIEGEQ